ncbi:MAG: EthD family reductase [Nitriliruptoraceae bacterium]|nr:EthD family reductase [Nitriliruptoraceae bacterium]
MIKLMALVTRRADLTQEAFARYWLDVHAPLALAQHPLGYVIDVASREQPADAMGDVHGIAEIWWRDHEHMRAGLDSEAGRIAADDVANFAASVRFVVVEPNRLLDPPGDETR